MSEQYNFTPQINNRSKKIERKEKIEDRLYNISLRKDSSGSNEDDEENQKSNILSNNSEKFITFKFFREFLSATSPYASKKLDYIALRFCFVFE